MAAVCETKRVHIIRLYCQGRHNVFENGGTISQAKQAKKNFGPHIWLTWGDMKQNSVQFDRYDV